MKSSLLTELSALMDGKLKIVNDEISKINVKIDENYNSLMAANEALKTENRYLHNQCVRESIKLLDLQIHSMKYNVIVPNIEESNDPSSEDTDALIGKFKSILTDHVKMNPAYVETMTFKAAHRLGNKSNGRPRSTILVFDKLHHVSDMWVKVKTLGRDCKYHFKTHLPRELAEYKSSLLKERIDMRKDDERLPVRVGLPSTRD